MISLFIVYCYISFNVLGYISTTLTYWIFSNRLLNRLAFHDIRRILNRLWIHFRTRILRRRLLLCSSLRLTDELRPILSFIVLICCIRYAFPLNCG